MAETYLPQIPEPHSDLGKTFVRSEDTHDFEHIAFRMPALASDVLSRPFDYEPIAKAFRKWFKRVPDTTMLFVAPPLLNPCVHATHVNLGGLVVRATVQYVLDTGAYAVTFDALVKPLTN